MMAGCSHLQAVKLSKGIVLAPRRSGRPVLVVALDIRHKWVLTVNLGGDACQNTRQVSSGTGTGAGLSTALVGNKLSRWRTGLGR